MEFTVEKHPTTTVLKAAGRMDITGAPEFEKKARDLINEGVSRIVIDMEAVDYVSSAGLRAILVAAKKAKAVKSEIVFSSVTGMVLDVFSMSGFKAMFRLFETSGEALAGD